MSNPEGILDIKPIVNIKREPIAKEYLDYNVDDIMEISDSYTTEFDETPNTEDCKNILSHGCKIGYLLKLKYIFKNAEYYLIQSDKDKFILLQTNNILLVEPWVGEKLKRALQNARNVIVIFCIKGENKFSGFARVVCEADEASRFSVDWISKKSVTFDYVKHIQNSEKAPIYNCVNGSKLSPQSGEELCKSFPKDEKINLIQVLQKSRIQCMKSNIKNNNNNFNDKRINKHVNKSFKHRHIGYPNYRGNNYNRRPSYASSFISDSGYSRYASSFTSDNGYSRCSSFYSQSSRSSVRGSSYSYFPRYKQNHTRRDVTKDINQQETASNIHQCEVTNDISVLRDNRFIKKLPQLTKILIIGTGGIGCEILKCLVQAGIKDLEIVDMDVVRTVHLNNHFVFKNDDLGKSKSRIVRARMTQRYPNIKISDYFKNIISENFSVFWFKRFTVVFSTVHNVSTKIHINRMCLSADIPLLYCCNKRYNGEVDVVIKGLTKCYECNFNETVKEHSPSTIRNTPTESIHCIIWAKNVFTQLFGEASEDTEVSPDITDPKLDGIREKLFVHKNGTKTAKRRATDIFAQDCNYNPEKLFNQLFYEDISTLLLEPKLWDSENAAKPVKWETAKTMIDETDDSDQNVDLHNQVLWDIWKCADIFQKSIYNLKEKLIQLKEKPGPNFLLFSRHDSYIVDFVVACSNIRSYIFGIPKRTRCDIIDLISDMTLSPITTSSIVAGLATFRALNIIREREELQKICLRSKENDNLEFIYAQPDITLPSISCHACSLKNEFKLVVPIYKMTIAQLQNRILKNRLHMVQPEISIKDQKTVFFFESDFDSLTSKTLSEFGIEDGSILFADDFLQNCRFVLHITERKFNAADQVSNDNIPYDLIIIEDKKRDNKTA